MDIYHYNPHTGEFMGVARADKSPLETDVYLIPANATTVKPPAAVKGYARCYIDGKWTQIEDHRGATLYSTVDASPLTIFSLGPIPDGYTDIVPCNCPVWDGTHWLENIDHVRIAKLAALTAYRYDRETAGIIVNGARIKTDRESQSMINGAKAYSDLNEAVLIDWKGDGGWITINRTVILAIAQAVAAHVQACFSRERVHAEAINALTTVSEIRAYDFTTGWPT